MPGETYTLLARCAPLSHDPLPAPVVVAVLHVHPAVFGQLDPRKELRTLASKLGLFHPVILRAGEPGSQLPLL